ncbi:hypothetical protein [Rhizobium wenxiniae]|uniref:hypothetical protein n=1 Tax=Rhizobium wenxiniae TaxID=1737357 RepID=UPI003C1399B6
MRQNKGVNSAASGGQFKEPNMTTIDKVLYTGKTHTSEVSPEAVELVINSAFYYMREHADAEPSSPLSTSCASSYRRWSSARRPATSRHLSKSTAGSLPSLRQ